MAAPTPPPLKSARVVVIMRMGPASVENHVIPIARAAATKEIVVVRPGRRPARLPANLRYVSVSDRTALHRLVGTLRAAWREMRRERPDWVVSFNATPYGFLAAVVGLVSRVPVHVGFVGSDVRKLQKGWYARVVDSVLRRATLVTVPGATIRAELIRRGYDSGRLEELPHGIDTGRFAPAKVERTIDVLFVGNLVDVKRVHVVVSAIEILAEDRPEIRCIIVGDGPLRPSLIDQVARSGLQNNVELVGYQPCPETYFARAKTVVIASAWEGVPFVLIQGMCCGAVPVTTVVGSIGDVLHDDADAVLLDDDSPRAVAAGLASVLDDPARLDRLRSGALARRAELGFDNVSELWSHWLVRHHA